MLIIGLTSEHRLKKIYIFSFDRKCDNFIFYFSFNRQIKPGRCSFSGTRQSACCREPIERKPRNRQQSGNHFIFDQEKDAKQSYLIT